MRSSHPESLKECKKIGRLSPKNLWHQSFFWVHHKIFILLLVAGGCFVISMNELFHQKGGNLIFEIVTYCIQFMTVWAALIAIGSLCNLFIEHTIARHVVLKGEELRTEVKNTPVSFTLDELEKELLPNNPNKPVPLMTRLVNKVCSEAKDRKFESSSSLVQPYQEESLKGLFYLNIIQKTALHAGILGTFIGLIMAMMQLGNILQAPSATTGAVTLSENQIMRDRLQQNEQKFQLFSEQLFKALNVSFTTSAAGLEVTIIVYFLMMMIRRRQEHFQKEMDDAAMITLSLARSAINENDVMRKLSEINYAMKKVGKRIYEQTGTMEDSLNIVSNALSEQTEEIQRGVLKLREVKHHFDEWINIIKRSQDDITQQLQEQHGELAEKTIETQTTLYKKVDEVLTFLVTSHDQHISKISTTNSTALEKTDQVIQAIKTDQKEVLHKIQSVFELKIPKNLDNIIRSQIIASEQSMAQQFSHIFKKMNNEVVQIGTGVAHIKDTTEGIQPTVNDIKQISVKGLNGYVHRQLLETISKSLKELTQASIKKLDDHFQKQGEFIRENIYESNKQRKKIVRQVRLLMICASSFTLLFIYSLYF